MCNFLEQVVVVAAAAEVRELVGDHLTVAVGERLKETNNLKQIVTMTRYQR